MLLSLKYDVTFEKTGRNLKANLTLGPGFWAITGPNESGKSMIFEMARYLLFGMDALRGKAEDYKSLKASGQFVIKGNIIEIERTSKTAVMRRNGQAVTTGTKAVNIKVVEELGFGMNVFDVACSINQGEIEKLGDMRPAQRKEMVDSVLGLGSLDVVAKWAAEEARLLDRQADGLKERLIPAGLRPSAPADYQPSPEIEKSMEVLGAKAQEAATIKGFLSVTREAPVEPATEVLESAAHLTELAETRRSARELFEGLKARCAALPTAATFSADLLAEVTTTWAAWRDYDAAQQWLLKHPKPTYLFQQTMIMKEDWTALENIGERTKLAKRIEQLREKGSKPCPHCGEHIPLEEDAIQRLQEEHDAIRVPNEGFTILLPALTRAEIAEEELRIKNYDEATAREMAAVPQVIMPDIPEHSISIYEQQLKQVAERKVLEPQLAEAQALFEAMPDYEAQLAHRRSYEASLIKYRADRDAYLVWQTEVEMKKARAAELEGIEDDWKALRGLLGMARVYEGEVAKYQQTLATYELAQVAINKLMDDALEHRKVREVMNVLRGFIKQHVLPSLNVVASQLLRKMTGGQRNVITVDEDFNVIVDNQDLETLSGSGKACANLSLRIALGQVLTNRVISIMFADEIDASMDTFRAEQTANILPVLAERVSQVVLVSHKPIDAPNHVRLGEDSDSTERSVG